MAVDKKLDGNRPPRPLSNKALVDTRFNDEAWMAGNECNKHSVMCHLRLLVSTGVIQAEQWTSLFEQHKSSTRDISDNE